MDMHLLVFVGILASIAGLSSAGGNDWDVHDDEKKWCKDFKLCCDGKSQSPIDIETKKAVNGSYSPLTFSAGYFEKTAGRIYNTETYAGFFEPEKDNAELTITGGPLGSDSYVFHDFHFYFGKSSKKGSPHFLDGKQYPGELHLVHYNTKYDYISEALKEDDGVAVLAFLLKEEKKVDKEYPSFKSLEKSLRKTKKGKDKKLEIALSNFFLAAGGVSEYYSYPGSMMTPPCTETIQWLVFKPIDLKKSLFEALRKLEDEDGHKLRNNFRKLQDLNDRVVTHAKED